MRVWRNKGCLSSMGAALVMGVGPGTIPFQILNFILHYRAVTLELKLVVMMPRVI